MSTEALVGGDNVIGDRYQLQSLLGHGGMGMVWSAHDRRLDRRVALKLLRPDVPESTARQMEREARAAARVDDQRVVNVLDLDHMEDGRPFLVLELHDGWTLADELRDGPLAPDRFRQLTEDLLGGLAAAHRCGVLHRDIKPANVLAEAGGFRITDFGLASIGTDQQTDPRLMGTLAYVAPERLYGTPGTCTADVFSAGVVLYEAASGHKPFAADTPADAVMAVRSRRVAPLPDHVPAPVREAIHRALDPDPDHRPQDAARMLAAAQGAPGSQDLTVVLPDQPDRTRPITGIAAVDGSVTSELLRPRSGLTRTLPTRPKPTHADGPPTGTAGQRSAEARSSGRRSPWRQRPGVLVAAAVALAVLVALAASVSGGGSDATSRPGTTPSTTTVAPPASTTASTGTTTAPTTSDPSRTNGKPGRGHGRAKGHDG